MPYTLKHHFLWLGSDFVHCTAIYSTNIFGAKIYFWVKIKHSYPATEIMKSQKSRKFSNTDNIEKSEISYMKSSSQLKEFFRECTQNFSAHGVKYLGLKEIHPVERLFWTIVMLASIGCSIYLVYNVYSKYQANPVIISFQPQEITVAQIPFPAITICNVNLLRTSVLNRTFVRLNHLAKQYEALREKNEELAPDDSAQMYSDASHLDHLSQFCLTTPSFRREINETIVDANGYTDVVELVTNFLANLSDSHTEKMHQDEHNNTNKSIMPCREIPLSPIQQAAISCEDTLLQCMWAGEVQPCKDLFSSVRTRNGRCCVFNMMPKFILQRISEDEDRAKRELKRLPEKLVKQWRKFGKDDLIQKNMSKVGKILYPKHQKAGGKENGLTVLVDPHLEEYSTCTSSDGWGFQIVAHSPLSYPAIINYGAAVPPNSEVFIDVEPEVTVVEEEKTLSGIDLDKRGCYLSNERGAKLKYYNFYSPENCFFECWAEHAYRNCSCVAYFMPRNSTQKLCGAKKQKCADEIRANLTKTYGTSSFCGHCYAPCTEILYKLKMTHFEMRELSHQSANFLYNDSQGVMRNATSYSTIHIYMGRDSLYAKERKKLFDTFDLIANAGGLLSLTLGISIICFIEIGYFGTLRAWFKFRSLSKDKSINEENVKEASTKSRNKTGTRTHSMITRSRKNSSAIQGKKNDEYYNWAIRNRLNVVRNTSPPAIENQPYFGFLF